MGLWPFIGKQMGAKVNVRLIRNHGIMPKGHNPFSPHPFSPQFPQIAENSPFHVAIRVLILKIRRNGSVSMSRETTPLSDEDEDESNSIFVDDDWPGMGKPLKDQLIRELSETGQTNFTDLEIALIASGVAEPDALQAYIEKYKALTERLKLNDKQLKLNPKKKARTIYKLVFSNLKREDPSISGILSILDNGSYSPLSATWLYVAASQDAGLDPSAYSTMKERLDPYFLDGNPTSLKDIAASFLTVQAAVADENHLKEAGQSLKLSTLLSPQSTHGKGFSDVTLYNMALKQFNANAFVPAAWLALGATQRYPDVKEFQGLCYNIGIKIFQGT